MESAAREAQAYFGRPEIYLERYLAWPRHVEMQVLADQHGTTLWLGERDCSAQRRHQKLIEESPAPDFPDEVRQAMGAAAVKVSEACGYYNAGTVEFLYQDGEFYFLEMNTRLQVEHPVTELVTGLDLVAWQIRIASGEPLDFTQDDIRRNGHAIEVRINAEDPSGGRFSPSPGTITSFHAAVGARRPPRRRLRVRRHGLAVLRQPDRQADRLGPRPRGGPAAHAAAPSARPAITGVATTLPADVAILSHPDFAAATHSTKWVEDVLDLSGLVVEPPAPRPRRRPGRGRGARPCSATSPPRWTAGASRCGSGCPTWARRPRPAGRRPAQAGRGGGRWPAAARAQVTVPMQGTIVKVLVAVGDVVEVGQTICLLEAMKMENAVAAEKDGVIKEVRVSAGDSVGAGDVVAVIE